MSSLQVQQDALDDARDLLRTQQMMRRGAALLIVVGAASTLYFSLVVAVDMQGAAVAGSVIALLLAMFCFPAAFATLGYLHYSATDYNKKRSPSRWVDAKRAVRDTERSYEQAVAAETERIIRGIS